MKYIPPMNGSENEGYVDWDRTSPGKGSIPPAAVFEKPQREIVNVITAAGLTPSEESTAQLNQAIDAKITAGTGDKPSRSEAVLSATIRTLVVLESQAEYDALTDAEKADPSVLYAIKG